MIRLYRNNKKKKTVENERNAELKAIFCITKRINVIYMCSFGFSFHSDMLQIETDGEKTQRIHLKLNKLG